ncbi:carboxypeptidase M32 [Acidianus infernus]|uniref:Metal-dependent carboxypeptidase n=1 Tax=Acidianus infernus TaxID=12915 RepID=A0A6A9QGF2_ACIIN|nr:carboxypeptidase M32 [Acidianus infernus]MUM64290.1 carboxypeptidase M32 [Acidianus infernus]
MLEDILEEYKKAWALGHALALMSWDLETYMPQEGSKYRGEATAQLITLRRNEIMKLAEKVDKIDDSKLDDKERGIIRVLRREIKYYRAVPKEVDEELARLTSEAFIAWSKAKNESNFSIFKPYLEKIVDLKRKIAESLGYEKHPYNALLDLYEEGFTVDDADKVFSSLLPELKNILDKILSSGYYPAHHPLEDMTYDVEVMKKVNDEIINILEMPRSKFRIDISPHPFTQRISADDVRITTRYEGKDFRATMFSVIHESGHAIYELQIDPSLEITPVGQGVSMGVHESQSRFWENIIGRSREFVGIIYPLLKRFLDLKYDEEEIYKYFNVVRPSLIRVDADEVTYNLHIAIRYEIEKRLIAGELKVDEIPSLWNDLSEKYLGIRPKNDAEGALQDVHWSGGSFGYFPTYTLGNIIAGMIYAKYNVLEKVRERKFNEIKEYLREKIHKYGAIYPPKVLLTRSFGDAYNPEYFIKYLREKYLNK